MKRAIGARGRSWVMGAVVVAQFSACGRVERNPINDDSAESEGESPSTSSGGARVPPISNPSAPANGGSPARPTAAGGGGGGAGSLGEIAGVASGGGVAGVASGGGAGGVLSDSGAGGVLSDSGAGGVVSDGGAPACQLASPAIAKPTCSGEGLIYEVPNLCLGDGGLSDSDDLLEVYCCSGAKRFCLSGEECPWRAGCVSGAATCSRAGMAPGTDWMAVVYCCEWGGPRDFYCSEDSQVRDEYSKNPRY